MVNIECYYSDPESGFCTERVNKQVADLLSVMIKRKEKRQCDNDIPVISSYIQYYNDKHYYGNILYLLPNIKSSDYHCSERYDAILTLMSSTGTIKNITRQNTIPGYILCENSADERPDTHPENVTFKSMAAERIAAENTPESASTPEAEYTPGAEYTPETENVPTADMTPILPEFPVFRLSEATPEKKSLTLRYYEQEKGSQEKAAQVIGYTGKNQAVPESNRPDYYCSYHFRQKYQPPEPVLIYREKPGRFKLETGSETLNRRLKTMNAINGIDGVDIV
ncbi:hypothetical protein [Morganella morganii]|uniref:hypothetical protein n=1 Tax=Morganella morganii TaxID=582 RepID=UPI002368D5F6|nr:hypothetical protein [Morganella morganii]